VGLCKFENVEVQVYAIVLVQFAFEARNRDYLAKTDSVLFSSDVKGRVQGRDCSCFQTCH